jgi:hypothetical protein
VLEPKIPKNGRRETNQQLTGRDSQTPSKLQNDRQAGYLVTTLDLSYVGRGQPGRVGEIFLGPCAAGTKLANSLAEDFALSRACHA